MDFIKIARKNLQNLIFSNLCRQFFQLVSAFSELDISLFCPTCNQAPQVQMHLPVNDWVPSDIYNFNLQGVSITLSGVIAVKSAFSTERCY